MVVRAQFFRSSWFMWETDSALAGVDGTVLKTPNTSPHDVVALLLLLLLLLFRVRCGAGGVEAVSIAVVAAA